MDTLAELEHMALNASVRSNATGAAIARWQTLFGFSFQEARMKIEKFRADLGRTSLSEKAWSTIATQREAKGFDKESFEYSLAHQRMKLPPDTTKLGSDFDGTYIMRLEGPLNTAESIRLVLDSKRPPTTLRAFNDDRRNQVEEQSVFCKVSTAERKSLLHHIACNHPYFQPTFVRLVQSAKDLSTHSRAPFLGPELEHMLPQFRPSAEIVYRPAQDEYPVWYFFYGTLADPQTLCRVLSLEDEPILANASVAGGRIRRWGGTYNAMVGAEADTVVSGSAYKVMSRKHEELLQFFKTDMYEVVRCIITVEADSVDGLVFRFRGPENQLD